MIALVTGTANYLLIDGTPYPLRGLYPMWDDVNQKLGMVYSTGVTQSNVFNQQSYANFSLDGVTAASYAALRTFAEAAFFLSSGNGGGGAITFSAMSGNVWDGFKFLTLTADKAITTGSSTRGILHIYNTGAYGITVNGTTIAINPGGQSSELGYYTLNDGTVIITKDLGAVETTPPAPDTLAPIIDTVTVVDAHTIEARFFEPVTGTSSGWSFGSLTITGVSGSTSAVLSFTVSETLTSADVVPWAYNAATGDVADLSGNLMASASGTAANAIASASAFTEDFTGGNLGNLVGKVTTAGGFTWTKMGTGTLPHLVVNGGVLNGTGIGYTDYVVIDPGTHDIDISVQMGSIAGANLWLIVAAIDSSNLVQVNLITDDIYQTVAGTQSQLWAAYGTPATNQLMRVVVIGNAITVYRNGVQVTTTGLAISSALATGTKVGLFGYSDTSSKIVSISGT